MDERRFDNVNHFPAAILLFVLLQLFLKVLSLLFSLNLLKFYLLIIELFLKLQNLRIVLIDASF